MDQKTKGKLSMAPVGDIWAQADVINASCIPRFMPTNKDGDFGERVTCHAEAMKHAQLFMTAGKHGELLMGVIDPFTYNRRFFLVQ